MMNWSAKFLQLTKPFAGGRHTLAHSQQMKEPVILVVTGFFYVQPALLLS
jgi:hypothetical protein